MPESQFISPKQFGVLTSLSAATIARRLRDGEIPFVKVGSRVLIPADFVQKLTSAAISKIPPADPYAQRCQ